MKPDNFYKVGGRGEPVGEPLKVERAKHRRPFEVIQVWVVGRDPEDDGRWQIQGIYTSQELAEAHAKKGWFIGPALVDTPFLGLPIFGQVDPTEWPGAYYA